MALQQQSVQKQSAGMLALLREQGWVDTAHPVLTPLTGGVSSDIYLVEDGPKRFVVKRALEKLKVAADWFADTSRNDTEQAYLKYVGDFRADAVPAILASNASAGLFAMEYLGGFSNWKEVLLQGYFDPQLATRAGKLLGEIHQHSWGIEEVKAQFDTLPNFDQLRIDPYLRASAAKHPDIADQLLQEAERLTLSRECLIHGDFSPKNILYRQHRLVPLDCEVACFADAAFDLSFFLCHLYLKSAYHSSQLRDIGALIAAARAGYRQGNPTHGDQVETRCARLLPMLMLARVDGKSPVEYLNGCQQDWVRQFAIEAIQHNYRQLDLLQSHWFESPYA